MITALIFAWRGRFSSNRDSQIKLQTKLNLFTLIFTDLQLTLGLLLYAFFSPVTAQGFSNMKMAMKDPVIRFYTVEHIFTGILVVVFVHLAKILFKKKSDTLKKFNSAAISLSIAFLFLLVTIPWPWRAAGRALFP